MLIRTKQEIPEEWGGPLTTEEKELPWFNPENLTMFFLIRLLTGTRRTRIL